MSPTSYTFYEKIDTAMVEKLLTAKNMPIPTDSNNKSFIPALTDIINRKQTVNGFPIIYKQKNGFGRMYADVPASLQTIQKDIKKKLIENLPVKYRDIDISNCQPEILRQDLQRRGIHSDFLNEYCADRQATIDKYGLYNKTGIFSVMFNEIANTQHNEIKVFHSRLFETYFPLIANENKDIFKQLTTLIKRKNKKRNNVPTYNINGSLMAYYLQNIENTLLCYMIEYCQLNNLDIRSLAYDGLMVDDTEILNEQFLTDMAEYIHNKTDYNIELKYKPLECTFDFDFPEEPEGDNVTTNNKIVFSKEHARKMMNEMYVYNQDTEQHELIESRYKLFIDYMNNFLCVFDKPHTFGFKMSTDREMQFRQSATIKERVGIKVFNEWNDSDNQRLYYKMDFIVNIDNEDAPRIYNLYKRPNYDTTATGNLEDRMPLLYRYLSVVMCDNDANQYRFTLDWLSVFIKYGKTNVCLVFMGEKGAGKSFYGETLIAYILNNPDHFRIIKDIKRIKDTFNAREEFNLCSLIEEVSESGAEFHSTQNILKSLVTEKTTEIRRMHTDSFPVKSNSNYIISTNFNNPVAMTKDNRRFNPYKFSNIHLNDIRFFEQLDLEIKNNIEWLRGFLINRIIGDRRLFIHDSPLIQNLVELNVRTHEHFIRNEMEYFCNEWTGGKHISKEYIYRHYRDYHIQMGDNGKMLPWSRFKTYIMELSDKYTVITSTEGSRRIDVIVDKHTK